MQLQKEMQLALHPEYGQAESAALAKEVSRLRLFLSELQSQQHRLQADISNAIAKRETSVVKVGLLTDILNISARHRISRMRHVIGHGIRPMQSSLYVLILWSCVFWAAALSARNRRYFQAMQVCVSLARAVPWRGWPRTGRGPAARSTRSGRCWERLLHPFR